MKTISLRLTETEVAELEVLKIEYKEKTYSKIFKRFIKGDL